MRARAFLLAFLSFVIPASADEIACTGAFAIDSSAARLIEIYGAANVVTGETAGSGDFAVPTTTVYPDDATRRIEFVWWHGEELADPSYIRFPPEAVLPPGLTVGMSIDEIEALNGEPFTLAGFDRDRGGYTHFRGEPLSDIPGDCVLSADFRPGAYPDDLDVSPVMGDVEVSSDNPLLVQMDVRLSAIRLGYVHPDLR
jgi:hypothetical protein